jgi:hypothetical protein
LIQCIEEVGENPNPESISYSWLWNPCIGLTGKTQFSGERIAQRVKRVLTVKGDKFELAGSKRLTVGPFRTLQIGKQLDQTLYNL